MACCLLRSTSEGKTTLDPVVIPAGQSEVTSISTLLAPLRNFTSADE